MKIVSNLSIPTRYSHVDEATQMSCDAESVASKIWGRDQALIEPTTRPLMTLPEPAGTQCLHERITCHFTYNISEACMKFCLILYQFYDLFKIVRRVYVHLNELEYDISLTAKGCQACTLYVLRCGAGQFQKSQSLSLLLVLHSFLMLPSTHLLKHKEDPNL